jgi:uncharacterized protein involved in outer membrane biogenesis
MNVVRILLSPVFWLLRKFVKAILILAVIVAVILAGGNYWLPHVVGWQICHKTGFRAHIDSSIGSLFSGYIDFRNLDIFNPRDRFDATPFVSMGRLAADVNVRSLLTGTVMLDKIVIDIDNVTIIKGAEGVYNYQLFARNMASSVAPSETISRAGNVPKGQNSQRKQPSKSIAKKIRLGEVTFALKSVTIIDESTGEPAREHSINYRRTFTNVEDADTAIDAIVSDLNRYGVSIFVQSVFNSILHLPGIDQVSSGATVIKDISKETIHSIGNGVKRLFKK